jgi:hypothetical protein
MAREILEARVARLEESILMAKEDRIEAKADRKEIISQLAGMNQSLQSTTNAIAILRLEKSGERLDAHDERIRAIETNLAFWQKVVGTGFQALWKIGALMIGSGVGGGLLVKLISPH